MKGASTRRRRPGPGRHDRGPRTFFPGLAVPLLAALVAVALVAPSGQGIATRGGRALRSAVLASSANEVDLAEVAVVDRAATSAIDAHGDRVAYTDATPSGREAYLYDATNGTTTLLSGKAGSTTTGASGDSTSVAISANGRYVAFTSDATDLTATATNVLTASATSVLTPTAGAVAPTPLPHVYVAHVVGGVVALTRLPLPAAATEGASAVAISADGSRVAFAGNAGASGTGRVYLDDWAQNGAQAQPVDVTPSPSSTKTVVQHVTLSADGSTVAAVVDDGTGSDRVVLADPGRSLTSVMPGVEADSSAPVALTGDGNLALVAPVGTDYLVSWRWRQAGAVPTQAGKDQFNVVGYPSISTDGHLVSYTYRFDDGFLAQVGAYPDVGASALVVSGSGARAGSWYPTTGYSTNPTLARSMPSISGDGLHVVFRSNASELPDPPPPGETTIYLATLHDAQPPTVGTPGVTAVKGDAVTLAQPTAADDLFVVDETLSDNGTPVPGFAWDSNGGYTVGGLTPGTHHTFTLTAYDESGHSASRSVAAWTPQPPVAGSFDTTAVSKLPAGTPGVGVQLDDVVGRGRDVPAISGDGRYVAFVGAPISGYDSGGNPVDAKGDSLVPGSSPLPGDELYLADTLDGSTTLVTHQAGSATTASVSPAPTAAVMSADGRYVAYVASSTDLVKNVASAGPRVYVYDRTTGDTTLVPTPYPVDAQDIAYGLQPLQISADGSRLVVLTADQSSGYDHAAVIDWQTGTTWTTPDSLVSLAGASISADGSTVAVAGNNSDFDTVTVYDVANRTQLASFRNLYTPLGFSADGTHLLVDASLFGSGLFAEWDEADPKAVTYFGGLAPSAMASDGLHVAYAQMQGGTSHVYLGSLPAGAPAEVGTGGLPVPDADGSAVAYVASATNGSGDTRVALFVAHPRDTVPPSWPKGAALSASDVTTTSVHLSWPTASDNVGVVSYALTDDGSPLAVVPAGTTSYDVTGLGTGTTHTFAVRAKDAVGNASGALSTQVSTLSAGISPGQDPLVATAKAGGVVSLSWDPASGAAGGYRVLRDDGSGLHKVADVASGTTTYVDTGRLASTAYTYRVDLLSKSGAPSAWTKEATVTTPPITITKTTVAVPYLSKTNLAALGGELTLRIEGEANRSASAKVSFSTASGSSASHVTLTEDAQHAGTYTGTWTIPEGATQLTSVTGVLSDGVAEHDVSAAAAGLPVDVSGAIAVTVDAPPAGSLTGSKLHVLGPDGFSDTVAVDAPGLYAFPAAPGTGYQLELDSAYGAKLGAKTVSVSAGTSTKVELAPVLQASLTVTDPSATSYGDDVTVADAHGTVLAHETTSGGTASFSGLPVGATVTVTSTLPEAYASAWLQRTVQTTRTLVAGPNTVTVTHPALAQATLTGTVTGPDGSGRGRATVSVSEHVGGWDEAVTATADLKGVYSARVLVGAATVTTSSHGYFTRSATLEVKAPTTTHDVQLQQGTLTVHVLPPKGFQAGGVVVTLYDPFTGWPGPTVTIPNGQTDAVFTGLDPQSKVNVGVELDDATRPVKEAYRTSATIDQPQVSVTVQEQTLAAGTLAGTVTAGGDAVAGATLHAWVNADDRRFSYQATTGTGGHYSLPVVAGKVTVSLTSDPPTGYNPPPQQVVSVPAAATATADFRMPTRAYRTVHLQLLTTNFGGAPSRQTLDWTTNYHFKTHLQDGAGGGLPVADEVTIPTSDPSPLTFCADGREAGLPAGCATATFTFDQPDVTVTLDLVQPSAVTGTVLGPDGAPFSGSWRLYANLLGADAGKVASFSAFGAGSSLQQGLPAAGTWLVHVSAGAGTSPPVRVSVAKGASVDLGDLMLAASHAVDTSASGVVASPSPVQPGQLLQVSVHYKVAKAIANASIRLGVPPGTTMAPDSITVDGQPSSGTAVDGGYDVPLGALSGGDSGVVRYAVAVASDAHGTTLSAPVWLSDGTTLSPVGTFVVSLAAVSLNAPTHVVTPTFRVNGEAPPGSAVQVVDSHGTTIGTATAGPGGLWSAQVTLVAALDHTTYPITAETRVAGQLLTDGATVTYDTSFPQPTSITVGQPDGRNHTFDPADGTAYFTLVYIPREPIRVRAHFTDVSRIEQPYAWVGNNDAPMTCDATTETCTADVTVADWSGGTGVWVDYDVVPPTSGNASGPAPALAQVLAAEPGPFSKLQVTNETVSADGRSAELDTSVPGTGVGIDFTFSASGAAQFSGTPLTFNGVPLSVSLSAQADLSGPTGFSMSVAIPESYLTSTAQSASQALRAAGFTRLAALMPKAAAVRPLSHHPVAWAVFKTAATFTMGKVGGILKSIATFFEVPDQQYVELSDLQAKVDGATCLTPLQKRLLGDEISIAGYQIIGNQMMRGLTPIPMALLGGDIVDAFEAGLGVTFTGLGGYLVKFDVSTLVNAAYDRYAAYIINSTADDVNRALAHSGCSPSPPPPWKPPPPPNGHPTLIIDPSGHVTDAATGLALAGATAVVQTAPTKQGPWTPWQASAYGQTNPQVTAADGAYGWNTPIGWYRIEVSKPGYSTATTRVVHVLPEWTTLDVALAPNAPPPPPPAKRSALVAVIVSGSLTHGSGRASLTYRTLPPGVHVASIACTRVTTRAPLDATLPAGTYTILGSSCSGSAPGTGLVFFGAKDGLVVSATSPSSSPKPKESRLSPVVAIKARSRSAAAAKTVWVELSCAKASCAGVVRLSVARRHHHHLFHVTLASGRYALEPGRRKVVGLRATRRGVEILPRSNGRRHWRTTATVIVKGGRTLHHRLYVEWKKVR